MTDILVRLPWPPAKLSANGSQGDWRGKASAAKGYKATCVKECWAQAIRKMNVTAVNVEITFCPPTARAYDLDNALKKAKQGLDAVAEAVGVDDSCWRSMMLVRGEKTKGGAMLVHVRPLTMNIPIRGSVS